MRRFVLPVVLTALFFGLWTYAQTTVKADQGRPGTQGCWPVSICGAVVVVGPDGGSVPVNITQSIPLQVFTDGGFLGTVVVAFDAGYLGTTAEQPCLHYRETNTSVGAASALVPATPLANRIWVRICNSLLNAEGTQCICSATTTPTFTAASLGDPLAVSDCVVYPITSADAGVPLCICNGAGTRLPAAECALQ